MAETGDIAKIATKVSDDIFRIFGWERRPPRDRNWACVTENHGKDTHPSDVVFRYEDPVEHSTIYLSLDLKSFAKSSITQSSIKKALQSLGIAIECANKSQQWRDLYVSSDHNFKVMGLLFVYNHDNQFTQEFLSFTRELTSASLKVRRPVKLFLLGPKEINYLITVANDIKAQRGDENLSKAEDCSFFYPDLVRIRVKSNSAQAATIEMLTGPWQVLRFEKAGKQKNKSGYYCYYSGAGTNVEEFKYIFDYLFRHQLVRPDEEIQIRCANAASNAAVVFDNAKEQYALDFFPHTDVRDRLITVNFSRINTVIQQFSDIELGME